MDEHKGWDVVRNITSRETKKTARPVERNLYRDGVWRRGEGVVGRMNGASKTIESSAVLYADIENKIITL